jgi:transcriptional regulator with XRE-family HTH domain
VTASTIGQRIKAVRLRAGLGQEAFASALGCSKRALVSWELGGAEPPVAALIKLRRDYDVDVEWLALGEDLTPCSYFGPVDWDRLDRLAKEVDAVCIDVGLKLPAERRQSLTRILYDGGAEAGAVNRKQVRGLLLTLSLGK